MNAIKTILVPTDFSRLSDAALDYAATLAGQNDALLLIVHVEEPPISYGEGHFYYGLPNPDRDALRGMLNKVRPNNAAVRYQHHSLQGNPADEIIAFSKQEHADLIVLSSHGRTGLRRLLMGSVAEEVMRSAECPVLVVKPHAAVALPTAGGAQ